MNKFLIPLLCLALLSCQRNAPEKTGDEKQQAAGTAGGNAQAEWLAQATIYQVNLRQYTQQGTINAFREKLPMLKELGTKILLFMPVQPIGIKNRKGSLGNSYAISDYTAFNPEFGTMDDFKRFVTAAHDAGFKVILEWPAGQTSSDALWMDKHPDWYKASSSDISHLNYGNPEARKAMIAAMRFWIKEVGVDGFSAYNTAAVPLEFWKESRKQLDTVKPIVLMTDAEGPKYHDTAFNVSYGNSMYRLMNDIAKGEKDGRDLSKYLQESDTTYPVHTYRMYYITNYEENSAGKTVFERMPLDHKSMFVMAATLPHSIPMMYSGQEFGLNRPLDPFEKDTLKASDSTLFNFYRKVLELKNTHPALASGLDQGDFEILRTHPISDKTNQFLAYTRKKEDKAILVLLNFSDTATSFSLPDKTASKSWVNIMTAKAQKMARSGVAVPAHGFLVLKTDE